MKNTRKVDSGFIQKNIDSGLNTARLLADDTTKITTQDWAGLISDRINNTLVGQHNPTWHIVLLLNKFRTIQDFKLADVKKILELCLDTDSVLYKSALMLADNIELAKNSKKSRH